jgi:NADH:ubiquinone oxidoreductase subunit 6 (subunit J)
MVFLTTIILGTGGLVLLLRPGGGMVRLLGLGLSAIAFGAVLGQAPIIRPLGEGVLFYGLAAATVLSALAAVSLVHPLYCAVCFGLTLVGVSALMAYGGAQFLAAGTLIVYVGAILVVLLFVLMLAHPRGRAAYDWNRWEVFVSAGTAVVFLAMLSLLITRSLAGPEQRAAQAEAQRDQAAFARSAEDQFSGVPSVFDKSAPGSAAGGQSAEPQTSADQSGKAEAAFHQSPAPPATEARSAQQTAAPPPETDFLPPKAGQGVLADLHVARIGQHLFGGHWLAVQAAGLLLLAALVGAAVIIGRWHGPWEGPQQPSTRSRQPRDAEPSPQTEPGHNS